MIYAPFFKPGPLGTFLAVTDPPMAHTRKAGLALFGEGVANTRSAELKGPRKLLRIRPGIFDFEPELGLKRSQTKPKIPGTVPTDRHTTIPNDYGTISACFDDDPKLLNCEIAQPRTVEVDDSRLAVSCYWAA